MCKGPTLSIKEEFFYDSQFSKNIDNVIKLNTSNNIYNRRKKFRTALAYYMPPGIRRKRQRQKNLGSAILLSESSHPGDKVMDQINLYLDKLHRSSQQRIFHRTMLASFLRIIYGPKEFEKEKHRITAKYGFESRKQQVIICAPRRMGKTFATAYIMIVMCIVISGIEVSIFSPGKRQSVALMGIIVDFMKNLGEGERIVQRNEEKMKIRSMNGKMSKLNAYPSAVRTLKGVSGTICVLEEMAQIDPKVLYQVICPLMQVDITALIGISTITDENNFMTKYLKQKDSHGEPLFATKHIYLACQACREADKAHLCNHMKHLRPQWQSERKGRTVTDIMKGQSEMLAREVGGVASSIYQRAFPAKFIKRFSNLPPVVLSYDMSYDFMFHAIDPNGAGKASDIAITTIIRKFGQYIIIGLESFPCKTAKENHTFILQHVLAFRNDPRFTNTMSIFILENNLGMESDHINNVLEENFGNFLVMNERNDGVHTGFRTTHNMKMLAVETLREQIMNDAIRFVDDDTMISMSRSVLDSREMLIEQLTEFREMLKESETQQPKKFYSGKCVGKDDLIMSLLLAIHWSGFFYKSGKYTHFHH
jgi:hypothetical protein